MIKKESKKKVREKKHLRIRNRFSGTAQIIDDEAGKTLVAASTVEKDVKGALKHTNDTEAAAYIGDLVAKRAIDKGIKTVVFDRGGFIYHGKVEALADAARKAGLEF